MKEVKAKEADAWAKVKAEARAKAEAKAKAGARLNGTPLLVERSAIIWSQNSSNRSEC